LVSPTFHKQLLLLQIPKAQKETDDLTVFLPFEDLIAKMLLFKG